MKKIFGLWLVLLFFAVNADAQVLPGASKQAPRTKAAVQATSLAKQSEKAASADASDQKEEFKGFGEAPVKENFAGRATDNKYDNTNRKVLHFKIVEGEVVFDDLEKRDIMIFYDNYEIQKGIDGIVRCSIRLYVLNDLMTKISSLGFKLHWPGLSTSVQMNQVNPGVKTYSDMTLLGDGCLNMDKTPTIEVNRCRVKGMTQEECADAIKWFPK